MLLVAALICAALGGTACGPAPEETPAVQEQAIPLSEPPARPDLEPLIEGPRSKDGLQAILGTSDLGAGAQRIGFVLTSPKGIVTVPTVTVTPRFQRPGSKEWQPLDSVAAQFHEWPYGTRGLYTTEMRFPGAGKVTLEIAVQASDGASQTAELQFEVKERPFTPSVGEPAVTSASKTFDSVGGFAKLTTGSLHDRDLYATTIADAVSGGKPTVIVFASPAFCTNAVCGPQVEVLQQLKDKYIGQANFIHVDFYENPDEIQGDLERGRISSAVREWRLPSIEWTFVIDGAGIVASRFEAFATIEELEAALAEVL